MPIFQRNGYRFQGLRVLSETGPIEEFALAEELCLRTQKQIPIRLRLLVRVLCDLEAKRWVRRTTSVIPETTTWVSVFAITEAGERALFSPRKSFMERLGRALQRLNLRR